MTPEQCDALLVGIRERRLRLRVQYESIVDIRRKARLENVTAQIERKLTAFSKKLDAVDKAITRLEELIPSIMALKLEMEDLLDYGNSRTTESEGHSGAVEGTS